MQERVGVIQIQLQHSNNAHGIESISFQCTYQTSHAMNNDNDNTNYNDNDNTNCNDNTNDNDYTNESDNGNEND